MTDANITWGADDTSVGLTFGTFAGWSLQNDGVNNAMKERANVLNKLGNEVASQLHGDRKEITSTYKCNNNTNTVPPTLGAIINGLVLTGIQLSTTQTDFATMTLTGHNHATNAHAAGMQEYTHGVTLPAAFGAKDFLGGSEDTGGNSSIYQSTLNITCDHTDVGDADDDHLAGQNYNARMEGQSTYYGTPATQADSTWDVTGYETPTENTGFAQTVVNAIKRLTVDT